MQILAGSLHSCQHLSLDIPKIDGHTDSREGVRNHKRYIYLAGGLTPDYTTISRFRKEKHDWLKKAYKEMVSLCAEAGLVLLKVTATDGSKVQARVSKKSLYSEKRLEKEMAAIEQILAEAEEVDRQEDEMYGAASGNDTSLEVFTLVSLDLRKPLCLNPAAFFRHSFSYLGG